MCRFKTFLPLDFAAGHARDLGHVAAGWRQSGGRVAAEWRQSGGRVAAEWRQSGGKMAAALHCTALHCTLRAHVATPYGVPVWGGCMYHMDRRLKAEKKYF